MSDEPLQQRAETEQEHAEARRESERQLRYRRLIRDRLDQIVELADMTVQNNRQKRLSRSQLANVIAVAQASGSVPVVIGYIQYQMGRDRSDWNESQRGARERVLPREQWLGSYIISKIESDITPIGQQVAQDAGISEREARIDLTKLYLGYLRRAFIASGQTR